MQKILLTIGMLVLCSYTHAQTLSFHSQTDVPIKDSITIDLPSPPPSYSNDVIVFNVKSLKKGETITFEDKNTGSADLPTDYDYVGIKGFTKIVTNATADVKYTYECKKDTASLLIPVQIKTTSTKKSSSTFCFVLTDPDNAIEKYKIKVNLNSAVNFPALNNSSPLIVPDTSNWYLRIVTGGNFDFFNGPSIKDFAGDITLFLPNMINIGKSKFGLEFGINNYHYFSTDSSHTHNSYNPYFLNSQNYYNRTDSSKVVLGNRTINRKYDYNVWGIHAAVLYPLVYNNFVQIYAKAQIEELATVETYTPTLAGNVNDTITYAQYNSLKNIPNKPDVQAHSLTLEQYAQQTFYDIYPGGGLSCTINIKNTAKFCFSSVIGPAIIELAKPSSDFVPDQRDLVGVNGKTRATKFYSLSKFQLITSVAPINIALGGEYRTVSGNMYYLTTYLGAVITLDTIKK
jgi:hypothetical protein